jgi:hypothetical protein
MTDVAKLLRRRLFATDLSEHTDRAFDAFWYLRHATEEATLVHARSSKNEDVDTGTAHRSH